MTPLKIALIIPTYNAAKDIPHLMPAIMEQTLQPETILIIDSSSKDETYELCKKYPVIFHSIPQSEFDHGATRTKAMDLVHADIYIFLTQDAYPAHPEAFQELISLLCSQDKIACVYGRQLPKLHATPLSAHARLFQYSQNTEVRSQNDKQILGIKTCFNSNSFAAYKNNALHEIGYFPKNVILGEDMYAAAQLLLKNYLIGYSAKASVFHSHNLTLKEEFHRYFSIGVFHAHEKWILEEFRAPTKEGIKFVKSELKFLWKNKHIHWIPRALMSTLIKYMAYKLGRHEKKIPWQIKRKLGINPAFWVHAAQKSI